MEIFTPVKRRGLDVYELFSGPYLYIRSDNFKAVLRVKSITGLTGLVTEGDSGRSSKAIPATDGYVQDLIAKDAAKHEARSFGVGVGSFVRILDGAVRDFCGHVTKRKSGRAEVTVELKTKKLFVSTPVRNLLNLDHVPQEKRVFYFSPLVEDLDDASLVKQDLHTLPEIIYTEAELTGGETINIGKTTIPRPSSVTNFFRKAAKLGQTPREMLESCVKSLAKGEIMKRPKNLFIVYCLLKAQYSEANKIDTNWRKLRKHMPEKDYVVMQDVFACAERAGLEIPRRTPDALLSRDGRSRENRRKKS